MSHAEPSGRVALLAGLSAAFIAVSFGYLHRTVFLDWHCLEKEAADRWKYWRA